MAKCMLVGNSDGIGLAATRRLLESGWDVVGVSKSRSPVTDGRYRHIVADVTGRTYSAAISCIAEEGTIDLCVYLAGIGELLDPADMSGEPAVIDVNLTGMVRTAAEVIPGMVKRGRGHFIGLSSLADELLSAEAPSYHASKAGFSNYLGGLALAMKPHGVAVTNLRFGFVDTKMAKGNVRPLMISVDRAVDHLMACICKRPGVYTAPALAVPLVKFRKIMMRFGAR